MKIKKGRSKIYYTIIILFIFVLLSGHLLVFLYRDTKESMKMNQKINLINSEIDNLREENLKLRNQSRLLKNGEYIEKVAREQLGMIKEDEMALIEINTKKKTSLSGSSDGNSLDSKENTDTMSLFIKNLRESFKRAFNTISIKQN